MSEKAHTSGKKRIWVKKASSFSDAEKFDEEYYKEQTSDQRMDEVQLLREQYYKMNKEARNAHRKGLRRVFKVIKLA